ncbi:hypothetical protein OPV22_030665 [Ensete ventricosum]|uniref:Uncharacterized protein n=1 Tax=Ensete ventricosum TaxID=4639 RepID=A0AAV8Q4S2_ENSVE|nr:hypothetical protein OPV22_030665 [Ensete ventricosum]
MAASSPPATPPRLIFPLASPSRIYQVYRGSSVKRGRSFEKRPPGGWISAEVKKRPHKRSRVSLPRIPSSNRFVRAVGDPLVEYKEPVFEWERANDAWKLWDFVPLGCNISMRDKDPTATFEADKRRAEETLDRLQRQVELECEIHKAYPFLSEKALLPLWQLLPTSSPNSEEEGWQESAPVPAAAGWQQLDEQQHSSHSTLAPIFRSEPEEEEEQHHQSEISSPKLGAWLVELHQNSRFRSMPIVGSRSNSVAYISEPRPEPYLDSQSSFQHCMLWKYEPSDGQYLESSSELPELQHNMPVMQHGDRQQPLYSPSHSATSRGKQRGTEDLMPTPGAEKVEQYNLRHWKQRFGSKRQQVLCGPAPCTQASSAHSIHAGLGDVQRRWFQAW